MSQNGVWSCAACLRRAFHGLERGNAQSLHTGSISSPTRQFSTTIARSTFDVPRDLDQDAADPSIAQKKAAKRLETVVGMQLRHMEDPYHIGQYVEKALKRNAFDEALLLVQKASRGKQLVVAWNHLIDYQLSKKNTKEATRLYNDMKKRAQLPNERTYTVLFRGLAKSPNPKMAVSEAVKHYNALLKSTKLSSNLIHLNAVLHVCSRAGDMDALFRIVDTLNESNRVPDALTYTTILNALRHSTLSEIKDLPVEEKTEAVAKLIGRAQGLWSEIMDKWAEGVLTIDEELVCSMGRLLLLGSKRESVKPILDLLTQSMRIPNLITNPDADAHHDEQMKDIAVQDSKKRVRASRKATYAIPGRNTLSLILTILASSRLTTGGIKYWNLIVRHYGLEPDMDNWLRLLGLLKVAKASAHASSTLELMSDKLLDPRPYRIAMETCIRDNINPNVIENSIAVLETMLKKSKLPDIQTLSFHLRVALVSHFNFRKMASSGNLDEAKRLYGVQLTEALSRLWDPYRQVHHHYFQTAKPKNREHETVISEAKEETIALARQMFAVFNKVMNEKMLSSNDLDELRTVASSLNKQIQEFLSSGRSPRAASRPSVVENANKTSEGQEEEEVYSGVKHGADFVWDTTKTTQHQQQERQQQQEAREKQYRRESEPDRYYSRATRNVPRRSHPSNIKRRPSAGTSW